MALGVPGPPVSRRRPLKASINIIIPPLLAPQSDVRPRFYDLLITEPDDELQQQDLFPREQRLLAECVSQAEPLISSSIIPPRAQRLSLSSPPFSRSTPPSLPVTAQSSNASPACTPALCPSLALPSGTHLCAQSPIHTSALRMARVSYSPDASTAVPHAGRRSMRR